MIQDQFLPFFVNLIKLDSTFAVPKSFFLQTLTLFYRIGPMSEDKIENLDSASAVTKCFNQKMESNFAKYVLSLILKL